MTYGDTDQEDSCMTSTKTSPARSRRLTVRSVTRWASALAVLLSLAFVAQAHALPVVQNGDLTMSVGGLIQAMGEMEYVSDGVKSNAIRAYVWNIADNIYTSGSYEGYAWRLETAFGGAANANGTNGLLNLLDAYVDVPLIQDGLYLKVGQFKDPTNLESATDHSAMLFTEKSPDFNLFFNSGYEMGLAFVGHAGNFDSSLGIVQGAPNLPQRYLPEQLYLPLPLFLRIGYSNGIAEDMFHQRQTGFKAPDQVEYAVHLNGFVAANSDAGHSTLFSQMGGGIKQFSYNQDYNGNVLTSSVFNPYLSYTSAGEPVSALYYQGSIDFQLRAPLSNGKTFALQGQGSIGHFDTTVQAGDTNASDKILGQPVVAGNSYSLNIFGAELIASIQDPVWTWALRLAMVIPDAGLQGQYTATSAFVNIFANTNPIWEVTPAVSYNLNRFVKVTTEVMFMFNAPEAQDDDGNYVIAEMPSTASSTGSTYLGSNIAANFVPIGRMMLQVSF